jgi:hypothetical protein
MAKDIPEASICPRNLKDLEDARGESRTLVVALASLVKQ